MPEAERMHVDGREGRMGVGRWEGNVRRRCGGRALKKTEEILHGKINAELEFWFNMQVQRKPALKIPSDYNRMQDATRVCVWGGRGGIHNA